jgi:uncharacterized membrane protein
MILRVRQIQISKREKKMERFLAVIVDTEANAFEATRIFKQLEDEGNITVYSGAVIQKTLDGRIVEKKQVDDFPIAAVGGTAMGAMIGLLAGGPLGMAGGAAVGGVSGGMLGSFADIYRYGVSADFLDDVSRNLTPGKFAVIVDANEEWVTPVDTEMERIGAFVFRTAKQSFEASQRAEEIAVVRADIQQLKAELATAHANRKAKIQAQLTKLEQKLQAQADAAEKALNRMKSDTEAKVKALQANIEKARAEAKSSLKAQVKRIEQDYEESDRKLRQALAEKLRTEADRVERKAHPAHQ